MDNFTEKAKEDFECYEPLRPAPQLTVTKISTYTIYLYTFITVKTALQLNRLSRTGQTAVTIRSLLELFLVNKYKTHQISKSIVLQQITYSDSGGTQSQHCKKIHFRILTKLYCSICWPFCNENSK